MQGHDGGSRYCAYLLRCWQEPRPNGAAPAPWRFSLEDPHTGLRRGFATWEALITFLQGELWAEGSSAPAAEANA